jgi:hypothetical protein
MPWWPPIIVQDPVNLLIHIYAYSQSAPLPSYQLEGKNWPTCKTVKHFSETWFAETLRMFGYHFADTFAILLKFQWLGRHVTILNFEC